MSCDEVVVVGEEVKVKTIECAHLRISSRRVQLFVVRQTLTKKTMALLIAEQRFSCPPTRPLEDNTKVSQQIRDKQ